MADATGPKKRKRATVATPSTASAVGSLEGMLPPQAIEMERAVLGAIMLEPEAYYEVSQIISAQSFYVKAHEVIYDAIVTLAAHQKPLDMLSVIEELRRTDELETAGGAAAVAELTRNVAGAANLEYHAHIVADKAMSRGLIGFASGVMTRAYEDAEEVDQQVQAAESTLFELAQFKMRKDIVRVDELKDNFQYRLQEAANKADGISGIPSGLYELDRMTNGWQRGELIVIGARPRMGKTAFAMTMIKTLSIDQDVPTLFFSMEMTKDALMDRLVSNFCEIPLSHIRSGKLEDYEWETLKERLPLLEGKPAYLDESTGLSIFELRSKSRRAVREKGVQMIIIDYLQLMNAEGTYFGNREQEIALISRSLKSLAKELNLPIIVLAQLNREVDKRMQGDADSKKPQLSDLRESGSIEQDADVVCFIHRPEEYGIRTFSTDNSSTQGKAEFIVAKHRNGPTGDIRLSFLGEFTKFVAADAGGFIQRESSMGIGGLDQNNMPPEAFMSNEANPF